MAQLVHRHTSRIALPAMLSSVPTARLHTRTTLTTWHLPTLTDDAELIVSELVTNALQAITLLPAHPRYPDLHDHPQVIRLSLTLHTGGLLIEVHDPSPHAPRLRQPTPDTEGGRGLLLVTTLARQWGTRWPPTGGKTVWALLTPEAAA